MTGAKSRKWSRLLAFMVGGFFCATAFASVPRYSVNTSGGNTVLDALTLLEWEQVAANNQGTTWQQALAHCEELDLAGHQDWRLPNVLELSSVIDETQSAPAINTTYFVDFVNGGYWTSTSDPSRPDSAYVVYFNNIDTVVGRGGVESQGKTSAGYVLCVRTQ